MTRFTKNGKILLRFGKCVCMYLNTQQILRKDMRTQNELMANTVSNEINADVRRTVGIIENIKTSVERSCTTDEEIEEYIYSIADAYPETIPTGIYCGLSNGTYIDKMWTGYLRNVPGFRKDLRQKNILTIPWNMWKQANRT